MRLYIYRCRVRQHLRREERKKGFSPAVFISMFGLFKGAIQLCHCCQASKTVYIHDKGIYLILITSLQARPGSPVTCKLITFKQELEKKKKKEMNRDAPLPMALYCSGTDVNQFYGML